MKILLLHNSYQHKGGEDAVVESEKLLLESNGHKVALFEVSNDDIKGIRAKIKTALNTTYSRTSKDKVLAEISKVRPDVAHVHNFFPLITPSVYDACMEAGVPVVQTLHNFRTICPGALLMRNGNICEDCLTASAYKSVLHGCFRGSILGTLAAARMVETHYKRGTWLKKVDRFIALTEFSKDKFIKAGLPESKIAVKPNFYSGEEFNDYYKGRKGALFVGRLSIEKGVRTLLKAFAGMDEPLRIIGDGPLSKEVQYTSNSKITWVGQKLRKEIATEMQRASFLIMPSECYETFGMVIIESFANYLPVIVSNLGAMAEIVEDGITGLHFEAGNAEDLAKKVQWAFSHPTEMHHMGGNARRKYKEKYTPEMNYLQLMNIYDEAIKARVEGKSRAIWHA